MTQTAGAARWRWREFAWAAWWSRALADGDFADSLREASMTFALRLGGWSGAPSRGPARRGTGRH